ncbi:hypothetical protein B0H14DRAFT_3527793 [Mycena olivaceomarginata]|nr:hypothetical protein B0H14DRAFT_3527793 [Mycena olivaceomarginata]
MPTVTVPQNQSYAIEIELEDTLTALFVVVQTGMLNLSEVFASQIAVVTLFANKAVESSMAPEADTAGEKGVIIPPVLPLTSERLERHMLFLIEDGQKIFLAMPPPVPSRPTHPTPAASRAVLPLPARLPRHCHVAPSQQLRPHRPPLRPSRVRAATPVPASPLPRLRARVPSFPHAAAVPSSRAPPVPSRPTPRRPPPVPLLRVRVPSRRHAVAAPSSRFTHSLYPAGPSALVHRWRRRPLDAWNVRKEANIQREPPNPYDARPSPSPFRDLIRTVQMDPWTHKVDDRLDARKRAYETMYTLVRLFSVSIVTGLIGIHLDTCLAKLELPTFLGRVLPGLLQTPTTVAEDSRAQERDVAELCVNRFDTSESASTITASPPYPLPLPFRHLLHTVLHDVDPILSFTPPRSAAHDLASSPLAPPALAVPAPLAGLSPLAVPVQALCGVSANGDRHLTTSNVVDVFNGGIRRHREKGKSAGQGQGQGQGQADPALLRGP